MLPTNQIDHVYYLRYRWERSSSLFVPDIEHKASTVFGELVPMLRAADTSGLVSEPFSACDSMHALQLVLEVLSFSRRMNNRRSRSSHIILRSLCCGHRSPQNTNIN